MYMRKWHFFFGIAFIFLFGAACKRDDDVHQNIDQTINFYFQDTNGKDLIIPNDPEGYAGKITYVDDFSINNNATVSGITSGVDASKKNYMQYIAGATRRVSKDSTATSKTYTSRLFISYSKRTNNDTKVMPQDTLDIVYSWTPSLFNVSTISVNKKVVFNSSSGQQKNITITKQ
ncbi:hypothetical protein [Elizabethkingia anophelis]|uniref:hypothetical protein n=1 Tax=Elizabethkingia anophelis TaxID=1117645 RepID=UPI0038917290